MEKAQQDFLQAVRDNAEYWAKQSGTKEHVCNGLAFSIMVLLDGYSNHNLRGYSLFENSMIGKPIGENLTGSLHDDYRKTTKAQSGDKQEM